MNSKKETTALLKYIIVLFIFGTVSIFVKFISFPSEVICIVRGILGALVILIMIFIKNKKVDWKGIKKDIIPIVSSGLIMGFNWYVLFEAYNYAPVSVCSLCYYMQAVFLPILAFFVLKEKIRIKKAICIGIAVVGMAFISGIIGQGTEGTTPKGVILGVLAGLMYALVVLINKKVKHVDAKESTMIELICAGLVLFFTSLFTLDYSSLVFDIKSFILLLILSVFHTGIAYVFYFRIVRQLPSSTVGIFGYLDPIVSIILSALLLKEAFSIWTFIGTVLIIGALVASEISKKVKNETSSNI